MEICVVGPGALGCLHAALLGRAGASVSLLDHRPERARLIRERGILIDESAGTWLAHVRCSADPRDLPPADLLVLCVKTFQTAAAIEHAASLVRKETIVIRIQNGLASPDCVLRVVAADRLVLGTSGHGANVAAWGHIRRAGSGPTRLGPLVPEGKPAAEVAAEALRLALADVQVLDDVWQLLWQKLLVNVAINPLTAITGLRNGQILEVPLLRAALRDIAGEAESVAIARGIALERGEARLAAEEACRLTAHNRSSMLQDVHRGTRTEIEDICGAVVREAEACGKTAPLNRVLTWLVAEVLPNPPKKQRPSPSSLN